MLHFFQSLKLQLKTLKCIIVVLLHCNFQSFRTVLEHVQIVAKKMNIPMQDVITTSCKRMWFVNNFTYFRTKLHKNKNLHREILQLRNIRKSTVKKFKVYKNIKNPLFACQAAKSSQSQIVQICTNLIIFFEEFHHISKRKLGR